MLMTGDPITADEAYRLGMVNELHPPAELMGGRAVRMGEGQPIEQAIAIMIEAHWRSAVHPDRIEGIGAFNEAETRPTRTPTSDEPQEHARIAPTRRLRHDHHRRTRTGTLRTSHDQPGSLQRRSATRGTPRRDHSHRTPLRPQQLRASHTQRHTRDRRSRPAPNIPHVGRSTRHASRRAIRHPRMRRQRPTRHATTPDRRTMGRLRRLHRPLDRHPPQCRARTGAPADNGVDVRFEGADSGPYHLHPILADTNKDDLTFVRALPLALAADPAAEILIAYEMNGEPLRPDHGAPFRIIVPHWFAVASVKWLQPHRRAHRAIHGRVPDRPLHL